jgi:hypothetical protein
LTEADGSLLARFSVFGADACSVFQEDVTGGGGFTAAKEFLDILLDVARGDAPRFRGH